MMESYLSLAVRVLINFNYEFLILVKRFYKFLFVFLCLFSSLNNYALSQSISFLDEVSTHRFFDNAQIDKTNISNLSHLWTFSGRDVVIGDTTQVVPLAIGDKLISVSPRGKLRSIDIETGDLHYEKQLLQPLGRRGFNVISSTDGSKKFIIIASGQQVLKIDADDGKILQVYQTGFSLLQPYIFGDNLIVSTLKEGIKSFNIETGIKNWHLSLNKNGLQSRIWAGAAFDNISKSLFVVTSNPGGIVGVGRGLDDYSVSLLAIDAESGKLKWQFKHIINDLWDLDLAGPPIIIDIPDSTKRAVLSVSKTGDIIYLDIQNGRPIFRDSIRRVNVESSDIPGVIASKTQPFFVKPEPFAQIVVDPLRDFDHLNVENKGYVQNKLRHARYGFYTPPSVNYDVVMYGIHGGADWPGASYDVNSHAVTVPYNKVPFILRIFNQETKFYYLKKALIRVKDGFEFIVRKCKELIFRTKIALSFDFEARKDSTGEANGFSRWSQLEWVEKDLPRKLANKLYPFMPFAHDNKDYYEQCSSCHGNARQGDYQSELWGDGFYPPLVGVTLTEKWKSIDSAEKVRMIHEKAGHDILVPEHLYKSMMDYFDAFDKKLSENKQLQLTGFWQLLLDREGLPATRPPWGGLARVGLNDGKKIWDVPLGLRSSSVQQGDISFGGNVTTNTGVVFVTGTPDEFIYGFDTQTGSLLWKAKLPFAGSAPPVLVKHRGCDLLVVTATGGRFVGYSENGDTVRVFKTSNCTFH